MVENQMKTPTFTAYTNGVCRPTPMGRGGFGAVIIDWGGSSILERFGGCIESTVNRMELLAIVSALREIPEGESVLVVSESSYALGILTGAYVPSTNFDLARDIRSAIQGKQIWNKWVQSRSGDRWNDRCEELAVAGLQCELMDDPGFTGYAGKSSPGYSHGGSMVVNIPIPPEIDRFYAHSNEHSVRSECAALISRVNRMEEPSFADFARLRCGGTDGWSQAIVDEEFPKEVINTVSLYFSRKDHMKSCLRWYGRGLALDHAIRREYVSQEIASRSYRR